MGKKRIFSGIQPSGIMTLGNYVGAITNWAAMQKEFDCIYSVVDLHALTVKQNPEQLRARTREMYALLVACGIDPDNSILFVQSHVPEHSMLTWILNCYTYMGELSRMTQFKEKSARHSENINAGLLDYPVLMAADILLYDSHLVPVGEDQKQHLELSRDIAIRFNNAYGEGSFVVPEPYITKVGGRVMSLSEPDKKMSKSDDNENAYISILDDPKVILKKIKRAVTDSDTENPIRAADTKPGVTNLINIYSVLTGKTSAEVEQDFEGKGYGAFKPAVAEVIITAFEPIQARYAQLMDDKAMLDSLMKNGAEKAREIAEPVLKRTYEKVGLIQL